MFRAAQDNALFRDRVTVGRRDLAHIFDVQLTGNWDDYKHVFEGDVDPICRDQILDPVSEFVHRYHAGDDIDVLLTKFAFGEELLQQFPREDRDIVDDDDIEERPGTDADSDED